MCLSELAKEVWEFHTRHSIKHSSRSIQLSKVEDKFNLTKDEVIAVYKELSDAGKTYPFPPAAPKNMITSANLIDQMSLPEEMEVKSEVEEIPPPPSDVDLDDIFKEMAERDPELKKEPDFKPEPELKKERKHFSDAQIKLEKEREYKAAQAHARNLIKRYNLKSEKKFRECQRCGALDPEIYIPDVKHPNLIHMLCHSHLIKERKSPSNIPLISIRVELEERHARTGYYNREAPVEYNEHKANTRKLRFKKRYQHLLPPLHCAWCGESEENTNLDLILPDVERPYIVIPLCRECKAELKYHKERAIVERQDLNHLDLVELIGLHVPPELKFIQYQIINKLKKKANHKLRCFVCEEKIEDTELYVNRKGRNGFYLTCPDCIKTAEADLSIGAGIGFIQLNLRNLDL